MHELLILLLLMRCAGKWGSAAKVRVASVMVVVVCCERVCMGHDMALALIIV